MTRDEAELTLHAAVETGAILARHLNNVIEMLNAAQAISVKRRDALRLVRGSEALGSLEEGAGAHLSAVVDAAINAGDLP